MATGIGATDLIAGAAVASPWWMTYLVEVSQLASVLLPIFGAAWLLIQIANFFWPRNDVQLEVKPGKTTVTTKGPVTLSPTTSEAPVIIVPKDPA